MKSRKCRIDHLLPLPVHMQKHQTPVREEPIHPQSMLRGMAPRTVGQLVEIRIGSHEEELLINSEVFVLVVVETVGAAHGVVVVDGGDDGGIASVAGGVGGEDGGGLVGEDFGIGVVVGSHCWKEERRINRNEMILNLEICTLTFEQVFRMFCVWFRVSCVSFKLFMRVGVMKRVNSIVPTTLNRMFVASRFNELRVRSKKC